MMTYAPITATKGVILNEDDEALTINHDPVTEIMTWVWDMKEVPTLFNREAAESTIAEILKNPQGFAKPHPQNIAARLAITSPKEFAKRDAAIRFEERQFGFSRFVEEGLKVLQNKVKPLTGYTSTGEAI